MCVLLSYWTISACVHCRFSINTMNSRCLHSFPFNLSRIKFQVVEWSVRLARKRAFRVRRLLAPSSMMHVLLIGFKIFFFCLTFASSFPYLFYRLMRPLSKVETRRGGSLLFLDFVSFLLLCLGYFPLPLFIFDFLNVPCLLLLLLCSYFRYVFFLYIIFA